MVKKTKRDEKKNPAENASMKDNPAALQGKALDKLPKDVQEKLKSIKTKLEKFQKRVLGKFDKYIVGIALLPPPKPNDQKSTEQKPVDKDKINVLVLVDDSDSKKMSKFELKDKLTAIMNNIAQEIDKNLTPQAVILSELWQNCYDGKYEMLQLIALSVPIFDRGMLAAIKIAEVHKTMVLKKFEKYIVSHVLAGSLVQGRATPTSDIDVWIVIDDTDVKKMTRAELKDKLRAIIIGMGIEAGELTGIKNKLNIQVYILTDFWDSLREANPIIFTLLRDGVPFYDRGIFMAWKQLLRMGKIKPSAEAIDMFMGSGEQMLKRVGLKLKDIGMEDIYYAILTPSQAALMLHGVPPPAPKETATLMREIFVQKEKLLEDKFVKILEKVIETRKMIEHGEKKEITGKEIDEFLNESDKYLKRIKRLFTQIEKIKEEQDMVKVYETIVTIIRDVLRIEGIERVEDEEVVNVFEDELISQGKIPAKFLRILNEIIKAKKDYDEKKLTRVEVEKVKKSSNEFIKFLVEYLQRKRGRELERTKIRVKHGNRYGEVILLGDVAFIIHDIDHEEKEISKARIKEDGSLGTTQKSSLQELEKSLSKVEILPKVFIKEPIFENLKDFFGKDVEILVNY
ncbi:MAG: nucleotidyltransferase domain-containing protein [Candidatus Woesearchaeota archaeon]|nr:nucleotidyltransferase domain-containing protein [Candidatus Woesearchaeota archaeon]|tara:strand:+ start:2744 stop:4621 length:1878 start_codon:yes stop_codon:yes gene_type:complete